MEARLAYHNPKHDKECQELGRLTPREIAMLREGYGLTHEQYAERLAIPVEDLIRIENGELIQSEEVDKRIRDFRE